MEKNETSKAPIAKIFKKNKKSGGFKDKKTIIDIKQTLEIIVILLIPILPTRFLFKDIIAFTQIEDSNRRPESIVDIIADKSPTKNNINILGFNTSNATFKINLSFGSNLEKITREKNL